MWTHIIFHSVKLYIWKYQICFISLSKISIKFFLLWMCFTLDIEKVNLNETIFLWYRTCKALFPIYIVQIYIYTINQVIIPSCFWILTIIIYAFLIWYPLYRQIINYITCIVCKTDIENRLTSISCLKSVIRGGEEKK